MEKLKLYGKKDKGKEQFLGVIYVNEKKEIVIDIKEPEVKKDIAREISKEIQEYGGIRWTKSRIKTVRDFKKYREELTQEFKNILGGDFEKYVKKAKKALNILKKLDEEGLGEKEIEEIEKEFGKKREELGEPIKKLERCGLLWSDLVLIAEPWRIVEVSILRGDLVYEKPGAPFFLNAVREYLAQYLGKNLGYKKYGGYTLTERLPIVDDKN
jgi:hypothetical protein